MIQKPIDKFYAKYDVAVFCDHTSGYCGAYLVAHTISNTQAQGNTNILFPDSLIYLGEMSAYAYVYGKKIWRVSE